MILNDEQLALLIKWPSVAVDFTLDDVAETIADLQRQLRERDHRELTEETEVLFEQIAFEKDENLTLDAQRLKKAMIAALDAYVQERVEKEVEAQMELRHEGELKASNHCPLCEKDYAHDHSEFIKVGYPFAAAIANIGSIHAVSAIIGHMVQERMDRAVLAESEWWDTYIDEHIQKYGKEWRRERGKARLAANKSKVGEGRS